MEVQHCIWIFWGCCFLPGVMDWCFIAFCEIWRTQTSVSGSGKSGLLCKEKWYQRQVGHHSLEQDQQVWWQYPGQTHPVIIEQACSDEAGLNSSRKVKSAGIRKVWSWAWCLLQCGKGLSFKVARESRGRDPQRQAFSQLRLAQLFLATKRFSQQSDPRFHSWCHSRGDLEQW